MSSEGDSLDGKPAADAVATGRSRDLSGPQWRSGIAAWLGWTFDGLDMHLYTLVYVPYVAALIGQSEQARGTWAA
jgi:hypothetical protein